jgi:hypothetical protein
MKTQKYCTVTEILSNQMTNACPVCHRPHPGWEICISQCLKQKRDNGEKKGNTEERPPGDGKCTWIKGGGGVINYVCGVKEADGYHYEVRYDAGPEDLVFFEKKDRIFLANLRQRNALREKEPAVWYLWTKDGSPADIGEWWHNLLVHCHYYDRDGDAEIRAVLDQAEKDEKALDGKPFVDAKRQKAAEEAKLETEREQERQRQIALARARQEQQLCELEEKTHQEQLKHAFEKKTWQDQLKIKEEQKTALEKAHQKELIDLKANFSDTKKELDRRIRSLETTNQKQIERIKTLEQTISQAQNKSGNYNKLQMQVDSVTLITMTLLILATFALLLSGGKSTERLLLWVLRISGKPEPVGDIALQQEEPPIGKTVIFASITMIFTLCAFMFATREFSKLKITPSKLFRLFKEERDNTVLAKTSAGPIREEVPDTNEETTLASPGFFANK